MIRPVRLFDTLVARTLPAVPRPVVRRFADRYMAGERLSDAVSTVKRLNSRGAAATVDVLGEFVTHPSQAEEMVRQYLALLDVIRDNGLDSHVSIKLTALGLEIDPALARENLAPIVAAGEAQGTFVRIDMEDSRHTDETLLIYRQLREAGHDLVGIVIQSYMRRSMDDVRRLRDLKPRVRLVKGIYVEPPGVAFQQPAEISRSYVELLEELLDSGSHVAVATHDESLVTAAQGVARGRGLSPDAYEFQLLLGVKEHLRDRLIASGERVRIYVPYGDAWYGYSLRRLKENPSIAGYVARDVLGRVVPR
jgi:proline dehydrogenase